MVRPRPPPIEVPLLAPAPTPAEQSLGSQLETPSSQPQTSSASSHAHSSHQTGSRPPTTSGSESPITGVAGGSIGAIGGSARALTERLAEVEMTQQQTQPSPLSSLRNMLLSSQNYYGPQPSETGSGLL